MTNQKTVGLVLSGGGVRGIGHIGVIRALEEHGIYPTHIAGASMGAMVGAFYAAGYPWDAIKTFFDETSMFSLNKYALGKPGMIDTSKFYEVFKAYFPEDRFEALKKPLYVSVTNILEGRNRIFQEGPLIHALLASAAFPIVLSPHTIDGVLYADGGITNNFPVEPLKGQCDRLIGSYVNPLAKIEAEDLGNSFDVLERAFKIGMASMSTPKFGDCDLLISHQELRKFGTFSVSRMEEVYEIGYETAKRQLEGFRD